jgi:hypothetical protein
MASELSGQLKPMETAMLLGESRNQSAANRQFHTEQEKYWHDSPGSVAAKLQNFTKYARREDLTKFLARNDVFRKQLHVHGSVVDIGVARGASLTTWAHVRERRDAEDWQRLALRAITRRYKNAQLRFLEELAAIITDHDDLSTVRDLLGQAAEAFSQTRAAIFEATAQDYERLLNRGMQHYRADLVAFIERRRSVPNLTPEIVAST